MKIYKCLSKSKVCLIWVIVLSVLGILFIFSQECKNGAVNGILLCLSILVPSLFPFFILSSFLAESNMLDCIVPVFNPVGKFFLGARGICIIPLILSLLGGYPVGAKTIASLYHCKAISESEAKRLVPLCCWAGPGFLVTFVGVSMLLSKESGIILLSSQIISVTLLCLLSRVMYGKTDSDSILNVKKSGTSISEALVSSVNSAVKSTAGMCGFVIAFSVVCNVLTEGFGADNTLGKIFVSLLEITTGISLISGEVSLEVISLLAGFGGVCVHLQIFRELKGIPYSKARFYFFRFIASVLCFLSTKILIYIFPIKEAVFSTVSKAPKLTFYSGVAGSVALIFTSVVFILSLRKKHSA